MNGRIHIGTSGWHYKHWLGSFYPHGLKPSGQLAFYLQHFNTVEINSSFYRLPTPETFRTWKNAVPDDFVFAVKASRFITHMKKLQDPVESLARFMRNSAALDDKLGPVLFQLPPAWKLNIERLQLFLQALPADIRFVFEFRHASWYDSAVLDLLKIHNRAFCIYDLAGHLSPLAVTADFVYVRLHGPGDKYQGSYTDDSLRKWAGRCRKWARDGRDVYVYFDNDAQGFAALNALTLQKLLKR